MDASVKNPERKVWTCKIGAPVEANIPSGGDGPMRKAVEAAFKELTGVESEFNFTGWGGALDEHEMAVIERRMPNRQKIVDEIIDDLIRRGLLSLVEHEVKRRRDKERTRSSKPRSAT